MCERATRENLNFIQEAKKKLFPDMLETVSQHAIVMGSLCKDFMKLVTVGNSI